MPPRQTSPSVTSPYENRPETAAPQPVCAKTSARRGVAAPAQNPETHPEFASVASQDLPANQARPRAAPVPQIRHPPAYLARHRGPQNGDRVPLESRPQPLPRAASSQLPPLGGPAVFGRQKRSSRKWTISSRIRCIRYKVYGVYIGPKQPAASAQPDKPKGVARNPSQPLPNGNNALDRQNAAVYTRTTFRAESTSSSTTSRLRFT